MLVQQRGYLLSKEELFCEKDLCYLQTLLPNQFKAGNTGCYFTIRSYTGACRRYNYCGSFCRYYATGRRVAGKQCFYGGAGYRYWHSLWVNATHCTGSRPP